MTNSEHDPDLKGFYNIKADKDLINKVTQRILINKTSDVSLRSGYGYKRIITLTASFILVIFAIGAFSLRSHDPQNSNRLGDNIVDNTALPQDMQIDNSDVAEEKGLRIPALELPKNTKGVSYDMIALFVYNGKIYTQTDTSIDSKSGLKVLGEKLGTTKGNIDEWSTQNEYAKELASTIGQQDVYTVKGYDKDFRLMTYTVYNGVAYAQFYECLNGITVQNGKDVFGKLNIEGNIKNAYYRSYDDWNNSIENFHTISDTDLYNEFVKELNNAVPYSPQNIDIELIRNQDSHKEVTFELEDGSRVSIAVYKNGYIQYGYANIYFKMEHEVFLSLWDKLVI